MTDQSFKNHDNSCQYIEANIIYQRKMNNFGNREFNTIMLNSLKGNSWNFLKKDITLIL